MTLKDAILKADREENTRMLGLIMDKMRYGGYKVNGQSVICTYQDTKAFFVRCGVDPYRFETLCQLADGGFEAASGGPAAHAARRRAIQEDGTMKTIVKINQRPFGNTAGWGILDMGRGTIRLMGRPDDDVTVDLALLRNSTEWGWHPATGRIPGYVRNAAR